MKPVEYVFLIDAFRPDTLPMARPAEYLAGLAKMFGHAERTHFIGVEEGSARLRAAVEPVDAPKVEARLNGVRIGDAPKEALAAKLALELLLANDNAIATLTLGDSDRVVLTFTGRNKVKPLAFPPFREESSIDGQLVSIGGRDKSAHAMLQDGDVHHTNITMSRELAKTLANLLYGPQLRMYGTGRFERQSDGVWKMADFRVDRYDVLDGRPAIELLADIRAISGSSLMNPEAYQKIVAQRHDGDGRQ